MKGISVGLGQLLKAEKIILMANGEKKSDIVKLALEGEVTPISRKYHTDAYCKLLFSGQVSNNMTVKLEIVKFLKYSKKDIRTQM